MIKIKLLAASVLAAGLLFGSQSAQAHCDSIDGPVAVEVTEQHDAFNSVAGRSYRVGAALLSGYDKLASIRMSPSRTPDKVCRICRAPPFLRGTR